MRRIKIAYWIFTILFAGAMLFSAIPDIILDKATRDFMTGLGFPDHFTRFIGIAKTLGCIAILIPGIPRIKEWAYAGLMFDLTGAVYSMICVYGFDPGMLIMGLYIGVGVCSYIFHHKILKAKSAVHS